MIGRKTSVGKRKYKQVMIYVPSQISMDSSFMALFEIGKPVEIDVDTEKRQMVMKPLTEHKAKEKGWIRRENKS